MSDKQAVVRRFANLAAISIKARNNAKDVSLRCYFDGKAEGLLNAAKFTAYLAGLRSTSR